ncbi:MAG: helix-turn-helix domain-containing protein [Pseudonocardiaceae bacterium]
MVVRPRWGGQFGNRSCVTGSLAAVRTRVGPQREVGVGAQVSAVLRGFRRRVALTQEVLAECSGVSVSTIRRLETGGGAILSGSRCGSWPMRWVSPRRSVRTCGRDRGRRGEFGRGCVIRGAAGGGGSVARAYRERRGAGW